MKIYKYNGRCNACGQIIRALRKEKKISQGQLAARLQVMGIDLEQTSISRIELGERVEADYELQAFAKIFHVKMEDLLEPDTGTE